MFLVVGAGMFAINQVLEYKYNAAFLKTPCNVCTDLNPEFSSCINNCFQPMNKVVPGMQLEIPEGSKWSDVEFEK